MHTVGRWALRVPDGTDGPPNVPLWMDRLAVDLTDVAKDNQGTLGARPASTALAPGVSGRYFTTTDELDGGAARRRVYRDFGLGWDELATLPVSRRMLDAAVTSELPAGLLTVAQFLALTAQPTGTVVRVQLVAPTATVQGVNVRLRLNGASASAYKWEPDGDAPPIVAERYAQDTIAAAGAAFLAIPNEPTITLGLAGDWEAEWEAAINHAAAAFIGTSVMLNGAAVIGFGSAPGVTLAAGAWGEPKISVKVTAAATGGVVKGTIGSVTAGNLNAYARRLRVRPMRVAGPAVA